MCVWLRKYTLSHHWNYELKRIGKENCSEFGITYGPQVMPNSDLCSWRASQVVLVVKNPPSKSQTQLKRLSMSTMFLKIIQRNGNQDFILAKVFGRKLSAFLPKFFQVEQLTITYFPTGCLVNALRQNVSINLWAHQEGNIFLLQKKWENSRKIGKQN